MNRSPTVLLRDVEVEGRRVDVRVAGGLVTDVVPRLEADGAVDVVVDGGGGALLRGLHDHHIHLLALAAGRRSAVVGPPSVTTGDELRAVLRRADVVQPAGTWIRSTSYHESVAGPLDRHRLDEILPGRPVRVQHRSGAAWMLNTAALTAVGLDTVDGIDVPAGAERDGDGRLTGRLFRLDEWLSSRLAAIGASDGVPDLAAVGRELAGYGVTGVTDATPYETGDPVETLAAAVRSGDLPQQVTITGGPGLGAGVAPSLRHGPVKLLLHDHDLPPLDTVVGWVADAHRGARPVAVHCVTRAALVLTLAAFEEAGTIDGDRIEHGAVVPVEVIPTLQTLGLTVVTQPNFVAERGDDYLADVDAEDQPDLWRCASLRTGGVAVAASTDAPFGDPNPWRAMAAATERRTRAGKVLGLDERIPARQALDMFLAPLHRPGDPPRIVQPGAPADLCLLTEPLGAALRHPAEVEVAATLLRGRPVVL